LLCTAFAASSSAAEPRKAKEPAKDVARQCDPSRGPCRARSVKARARRLEHLQEVGVDLYLDQQHIDTTTPTGKLLFQITGAFAEFERSMIRQRIRAGLGVIKDKLARDGKFESKAGIVRTRLGRPSAKAEKIERARLELAKGIGIGKVARAVGLGVGTVHRLKRQECMQAVNWKREQHRPR
jgi:DNA invertase Pin-like site-specific DNA recombinase